MQEILALEEQGWQALATSQKRAQEFYTPLLAENAVMLFPGGMRLNGKDAILTSIGAQPWHTFQMSEMQVISISERVQAIAYEVTARREGSEPYAALISSTYVRNNDTWQLVLHQQTPL